MSKPIENETEHVTAGAPNEKRDLRWPRLAANSLWIVICVALGVFANDLIGSVWNHNFKSRCAIGARIVVARQGLGNRVVFRLIHGLHYLVGAGNIRAGHRPFPTNWRIKNRWTDCCCNEVSTTTR